MNKINHSFISLCLKKREQTTPQTMTPALQADLEHRYSEAIDLYYTELELQESTLDSLLNLSFLLWRNHHDSQQINKVLSIAEDRFPDSRLPLFWKIVFSQQNNKITLSRRDWVQILFPLTHVSGTILTIPDDPDSIPYSFINSLMKVVSERPTGRNLFLRDVLIPLLR